MLYLRLRNQMHGEHNLTCNVYELYNYLIHFYIKISMSIICLVPPFFLFRTNVN